MAYTEDICHGCGKRYDRLGSHWAQSDCQYPRLTGKEEQIVRGLIMGDGCLSNRDGNPYLIVQCVEKEYLDELNSLFGNISSGEPRLHVTGEKLKENNGDWLGATESSEYRDQYRWQTRGIPSLKKFTVWYTSNGKVYPDDVELTPLVLKHWYAGDGNYNNNGTNDYISIGVSNESDNKEKINNMFERAGLPEPNRWSEYGRKSEIVWNKEESNDIMNYIGEPVDGYKYKWMGNNE